MLHLQLHAHSKEKMSKIVECGTKPTTARTGLEVPEEYRIGPDAFFEQLISEGSSQ